MPRVHTPMCSYMNHVHSSLCLYMQVIEESLFVYLFLISSRSVAFAEHTDIHAFSASRCLRADD